MRDGEWGLDLFRLYGTEDKPYVVIPLMREEGLSACFVALRRYFREVLRKPFIVKLVNKGAIRAS